MPPRAWPLRSYLELGVLPSAVPCARLHAKHLAWEWKLDDLTETIELLVSELTTNALQAVTGQEHPTFIWLRLSSDQAHVLIEVWDADPRPPATRPLGGDGVPAVDEEGGRGLFLVATLSQDWSWYPVPQLGGKVVWCELATQNSGVEEAPTLPRSAIPKQPASQPAHFATDLPTLRRVRDGLRGCVPS
jgi:anti-sigma regulatory factor (Ser/Thr protein kinase)